MGVRLVVVLAAMSVALVGASLVPGVAAAASAQGSRTSGAITAPASQVALPVAAPGVATASNTAASKLSLRINDKTPRKGERVWFAGKVKNGSELSVNRTVLIEEKVKGAKTWTRAASVRTGSNGKFRLSLRPAASTEYRARVTKTGGTKATSKSVQIKFTSNKRTLKSRAKASASAVGKQQSKVKSLSAKARKKTKKAGVRLVQYQEFSKATAVKVRTTSNERTWLVTGKIRKEYLAKGGPKGTYGVPVHDAKCNLIEGGCIQRFSRGTIYSNANRKATGTSVKGRKGEIIAAARSQVGIRYRYSQGPHYSKYNKFMGSSAAWCSMFQSWVSQASGNGSFFPQAKTYSSFLKQVRKTMRIGTKPKVGALVFMDTRPPWGSPNHVGIVMAISGSKIRIIDGNMGAGVGYRGVNERVIAANSPVFYAYPDY